MNLQRVRSDIGVAQTHFPNIETFGLQNGDLYIKAAMQSSVGNVYVLQITFDNYPSSMPKIAVLAPAVTHSKHMYNTGHICYMHPTYWNPARHDLKFAMAQAAVWLNKHEVYKVKGVWPGPGIEH